MIPIKFKRGLLLASAIALLLMLLSGTASAQVQISGKLYILSSGVSVSISPSESSGVPGETLNYTVTVNNTGTGPDNYDLTVGDSLGWGPTLDDDLLEVPAGESRQTTLSVTIPGSAVSGATDTITVTVISQADPTVSDDASCTARAEAEPPPPPPPPPPEDNMPLPVPALFSPINGTITNDNTPTFEWFGWSEGSDSSGVTYTLQVDNDPDFTSPDNFSGLTENTYTHSGLPDENYSWRVRAEDGDGTPGDWSTVWTLLIDTAAPAPPDLLEPADGALTNDNTPTFRWTAMTDPSGVTYAIQVDNDTDFIPPEVNVSGLTENSYTSFTLDYENYYWRVRAVDGAGNVGSWSENRSFTLTSVFIPAPAAFTVSSLIVDPPEVGFGEEVSISVIVRNAGDLEGTYTVVLKINGAVEGTENVTLSGGSSKPVMFEVFKDEEGTYDVEIEGLTGAFTVVKSQKPVRWPLILGVIVAAILAVGVTAFFYTRKKRSKGVRKKPLVYRLLEPSSIRANTFVFLPYHFIYIWILTSCRLDL